MDAFHFLFPSPLFDSVDETPGPSGCAVDHGRTQSTSVSQDEQEKRKEQMLDDSMNEISSIVHPPSIQCGPAGTRMVPSFALARTDEIESRLSKSQSSPPCTRRLKKKMVPNLSVSSLFFFFVLFCPFVLFICAVIFVQNQAPLRDYASPLFQSFRDNIRKRERERTTIT
jgi:hypothetical protein